MNLSFIDLFAGIGMFRMGLERAGHICIGWVEWDKDARATYEAIHDTKENGLKMTSEMLQGQEYQQQISGVPDSLAKTFQRTEGKKDWQEKSQDSSEKLYESLGKQMKLKTSRLLFENVENLLRVNKGWDLFRIL